MHSLTLMKAFNKEPITNNNSWTDQHSPSSINAAHGNEPRFRFFHVIAVSTSWLEGHDSCAN